MFYISKMPDNQDHYRKVESDTLFQFWLSSQQVNVYRQISNSLYFNYIQQKQTEDFVTHTHRHTKFATTFIFQSGCKTTGDGWPYTAVQPRTRLPRPAQTGTTKSPAPRHAEVSIF